MDNLLHFVQTVNSYLSDYILVILLIGVGLCGGVFSFHGRA